MKKVLVISYSLPPHGGIGGRRWAKFGRELLSRGYDVRFLSERQDSSRTKKWEEDHKAISERIEYFESSYPQGLTAVPRNIVDKLNYRLRMMNLRSKEKGNYFDRSCLDSKVLKATVEKYISNGYRTIIASGAPFHLLFHIAELKREVGGFKLITDLRDPWTKQDWSYGFQTIGPQRKVVEVERESFVMDFSDRVLTVADRMTNDLSVGRDKVKFATLHNGYDPKEILGSVSRKNGSRLRFVFAGNIYDGALGRVQGLCDLLSGLREKRADIYTDLRFDFYGTVPERFHSVVSEHDNVTFHGTVPVREAQQLIASADVAMLFLIDALNYSFSTKFFEYLAMDKKILLFASQGDTSEYLIANDIGWHQSNGSDIDVLCEIHGLWKEGRSLGLPSEFDKQRFSIPRLTDELESYI